MYPILLRVPRPVALERKSWLESVKRSLSSVTFNDNNGALKYVLVVVVVIGKWSEWNETLLTIII